MEAEPGPMDAAGGAVALTIGLAAFIAAVDLYMKFGQSTDLNIYPYLVPGEPLPDIYSFPLPELGRSWIFDFPLPESVDVGENTESMPIPQEEKDDYIIPFPGTEERLPTIVTAETEEAINEVLEGAKPGRTTKGKTTQWVKEGGYDQAVEDFYNLNPSNVRSDGDTIIGELPDGRTINVRSKSTEGSPTLDIYDSQTGKHIKIRYQ